MTKYLLLFFLTISIPLKSQKVERIFLTFNKTVHLFFPESVFYFDAGSEDILVQTKENILKLAPAVEHFKETNLTVITSDNYCYTFILEYKDDIEALTCFPDTGQARLIVKHTRDGKDDFTNDSLHRSLLSGTFHEYVSNSRRALSMAPSFWNLGSSYKKVYLALNNIFISNNKLYVVISVGNASNIPYDIDYLKLSIKQKKQIKKTSVQEIYKEPLYIYNKADVIQPREKNTFMVLVFEKFTFQQDRKLVFEMGEKNGERNILFDIRKDYIVNAAML
ncbi:MAG: conjugative transposon protein TraN [Bacteroidales bacterium]